MKAARVAVPILMTAAVLIPAKMAGAESGNLTKRICCHFVIPRASETETNTGSIVVNAVKVFLTIGSNEYRKRAITAGRNPMPNIGIMIASNASEGIVCNSPQRLKTIFEIPALSYANRLMARPKNVPKNNANPVSSRCLIRLRPRSDKISLNTLSFSASMTPSATKPFCRTKALATRW